MPNTITNRQMFFILTITMTSVTSVDIGKIMLQAGGADGWMTILIAAVIFASVAFLWAKLNGMHEGKMVFDYSRELVGKAGAYFLAFFFTQYFLSALIVLMLEMSYQLQSNFLPKTPIWATPLLALPVVGFVAYKGITNAARLIEIYGVIFVIVTLPMHALMFLQGDINHILPVFNPQEVGKALSGIPKMLLPFLGLEVLAAIPFSAKNGKKAAYLAFATVIWVGIYYVFNSLTTIMMIGEHEIMHYNFPLIAAIRQVELPFLKILQRIDLLFLTVGFIAMLSGVSIVYLSIVEFLCRMLPKTKRIVVTVALGAVAYPALLLLINVPDIVDKLISIIEVSSIFVVGIVPAVLLIITKVKKHEGKKT